MLTQSTVTLRVSRNYSKVANLKWSKPKIVHLSSSSLTATKVGTKCSFILLILLTEKSI